VLFSVAKGVMHPGAESTRETLNKIRDMKIEAKQRLNWEQKVRQISGG